jgi:nitroreductase
VDTFLAIASRREQRRYDGRPLPADVVRRILDAGRLSGSGGNRQPWTFVVVSDHDALAPTVYEPESLRRAALAVAIVVSGKGPITFDAGRAAQNMLLAAWNEGVGGSPNGIADQETAGRLLGLAEDEKLVNVLSFGYVERPRDVSRHTAEEWSARARRRPLDEVVRRL